MYAELTLVHAWDYRRYVLQCLPLSFKPARTPSNELAYTRKKIESNFSNFSAWHCRTKIFGLTWDGLGSEEVQVEKDQGASDCQARLISAEFELVTQALWTDPNDQSGWLYHRWLIGKCKRNAWETKRADVKRHPRMSCVVRSYLYEN